MKYNDYKDLNIMIVMNDPEQMLFLIDDLEEKRINNNISIIEDVEEAKKIIARDSSYTKTIFPDIVFLDKSISDKERLSLLDTYKSNEISKSSEVKFIINIQDKAEEKKFSDNIKMMTDEICSETIIKMIQKIDEAYYLCALKVNPEHNELEKTHTILLIEDNPGDIRLMNEMLKDIEGNFAIKQTDNIDEGLEMLGKGGIDLVFLDLSLPNIWGIDTFNKVNNKSINIPIIILTGLNDRNIAIKTVKNGAQDYLIKDEIDSYLLEKSIRYAIERNKIISELEKKKDELKVSKLNFANIIEKNSMGIVVVNKDKIIQYANKSYEIMTNEYLSDLIGEKFEYDFFVGKDRELFIKEVNNEAIVRADLIEWEKEECYLLNINVKDEIDNRIKKLERKIDALIDLVG